jgi:hypothetical protein
MEKWAHGNCALAASVREIWGSSLPQDESLNAKFDISVSYIPLVKEIVKFMQNETAPVRNDETLEMFEFMDAAQRSPAHRGALVRLDVQ